MDGTDVAGNSMKMRASGGGTAVIDRGPPTTNEAGPITTLGRLSEVLDALNGSVVKLDAAVGAAHTKLYGPYNFPPVSESEEAIEPEGTISDLTARVEGIERRVRSTLEIAESTEAQS